MWVREQQVKQNYRAKRLEKKMREELAKRDKQIKMTQCLLLASTIGMLIWQLLHV